MTLPCGPKIHDLVPSVSQRRVFQSGSCEQGFSLAPGTHFREEPLFWHPGIVTSFDADISLYKKIPPTQRLPAIAPSVAPLPMSLCPRTSLCSIRRRSF